MLTTRSTIVTIRIQGARRYGHVLKVAITGNRRSCYPLPDGGQSKLLPHYVLVDSFGRFGVSNWPSIFSIGRDIPAGHFVSMCYTNTLERRPKEAVDTTRLGTVSSPRDVAEWSAGNSEIAVQHNTHGPTVH